MWVAVFVKLSCTICMPLVMGHFDTQAQCIAWMADILHSHPEFKGRCERRTAMETEKSA